MPELLDSCRSALMLGFDGGKMGLRPTFRQSGTWTAEQGGAATEILQSISVEVLPW
jgi:hypothetical protein